MGLERTVLEKERAAIYYIATGMPVANISLMQKIYHGIDMHIICKRGEDPYERFSHFYQGVPEWFRRVEQRFNQTLDDMQQRSSRDFSELGSRLESMGRCVMFLDLFFSNPANDASNFRDNFERYERYLKTLAETLKEIGNK